ncbi:Methyltransferase domain-containing protein [Desulfonema magnum]|uniref:Methyltransferase domain-containing protein n=1 Tax=Desulfonema magnum TaxID=45655 RepID=A0A975BM99_9BACT|nr:guanitoxin biosynthesis pre-guanitoxin forming N-methyltransferase GntF [Desulfonema magnum]QTA87842.1 Methyltransferase domain-containing protein [Desulfonema magnum]
MLDFYHQLYSQMPPSRQFLEIGGGPTIYQLISASFCANDIVFSEYLEANRQEVLRWIQNQPNAFNWDSYFEYVLKLNGNSAPESLEQLKKQLRSKIRQIIYCDILQDAPLAPHTESDFDIISVSFCIEAVATEKKSFISALRNISSLLKSNGTLVMTLLKNTSIYQIGSLHFECFHVDENYLTQLLENIGYSNVCIQIFEEMDFDFGSPGIIALHAKKAN